MGSWRSGTTLLSSILGGLPGVHNGGELRALWKQMDGSEWLCGCGEPMTECPFWGQVVAASGVSAPEAAEVSRRYQESRLKIRGMRALARGTDNDPLDEDYRAIMQGLLHGLREVTGKPVILDDSKSGPDAVFYQRFTDERIRAIHVVRDPRAVAYSMAKRKLNQLKGGASRPMGQMGARRSSSFWAQMNVAADWAARALPSTVRVQYEQICRDPVAQVAALSEFLGIAAPDPLVDAEGGFERRQEHTVAGNPDRWTTGRERIRVDDKWRRELPRASTAAVTGLTFPLMLRYGYPLRARSED
jgi:LPS sulfotransferase NodH